MNLVNHVVFKKLADNTRFSSHCENIVYGLLFADIEYPDDFELIIHVLYGIIDCILSTSLMISCFRPIRTKNTISSDDYGSGFRKMCCSIGFAANCCCILSNCISVALDRSSIEYSDSIR